MSSSAKLSYYRRYRSAARRFEWIGGSLFAVGLLLKILLHIPSTFAVLFCGIGLCVLAIGAASLQPHNVVKSFAQQCTQQPNDEFAQGLLEALEAQPKIGLVASSYQLVTGAVELYVNFDDADPELAHRLRQAVQTRIAKKVF